jgi:D-alanyl-D-alanine carboxypeptidase
MNLVWAWGPSTDAGRVYARAAGMRFYHRHWLDGTATNWQNHHVRGTTAFTVELPAGSLSAQQVRRQVDAVLALATALAPIRRPAVARRVQTLVRGVPMSVSVAVAGRVVYTHQGDVRRPPVSNEKLLLSLALLSRFGPRHRIPTTVAGRRPKHGLVNGDLWLVGHGDPELDDAALERLARKLRAAGIRSVRGSVIGVTNTFTRERWAPGWQPIALRFVALPTALTFDGNRWPDPERRAAAALTADLRALGVRVSGRARAGREPVAVRRVLAGIRSAPLVDILRRQNADSLNLDAEVLTKMLGAAVLGRPGSIAKGARAIRRWARRHGAAVVAHDGSGLSYTDRVSTNDIVRLLASAGGATLRSTLPAAGEGTLRGRLLGLRVRAKTGTLLQQVSALSGWVWLRRSRRWAEFTILSRGLPKARAVVLEDALVEAIADELI